MRAVHAEGGAERLDLRAATLVEIEALVARLGQPRYRAQQLRTWAQARSATSFDELTDLPKELRARLADECVLGTLVVDRVERSRDGTRKARLRTAYWDAVEVVAIPREQGDEDASDEEDAGEGDGAPAAAARQATLCVSTQVGCAVGCPFCFTGSMGLVRHLSAAEVLDQVALGRRMAGEGGGGGREVRNLVFMGMGEPLHNLQATFGALERLLDPDAYGFSHRRVTVSTSGVVPAMAQLGRRFPVNLAISLHAATDAVRDRLVPLNRRWPLARLVEACRGYPLPPRRRITFEYVLLDAVNDADEDARALVRLLHGLRCKVNLLPYNEHAMALYRRPSDERVEAFRRILEERRVCVTVRQSRGRDIAAACGQLGDMRFRRERRRSRRPGAPDERPPGRPRSGP